MTTRQDIIWDLEKQKMSVREICQKFCVEKKEVIKDLKYISKSVRPKKKLVRDHAVCKTCGFIFKDRVKFSTSTKCPNCRCESISEVKFFIK